MNKKEPLKSGRLNVKFMVLSEQEAKELYNDVPKNFKNKLEDIFGKETFEEGAARDCS